VWQAPELERLVRADFLLDTNLRDTIAKVRFRQQVTAG
jgi:hypothetical protein